MTLQAITPSSRQAVHLLATYHLPSWQGGDRRVPRCERSKFGWCQESASLPMSREPGAVTCARCLALIESGWAAETRP